MATKNLMFTMRLDEEERARLDLVAAHYALNAVALLRMLVKREADLLTSKTKVKKKPIR